MDGTENDLIELEYECRTLHSDCCSGCLYEDECFDCSYLVFGFLYAKEWLEHYFRIIYAEGE